MPDPDMSQPVEYNQRLEAYLDGLMSSDEAQAFEQEVANDPLLQQEINLQKQIDATLMRKFVAPNPPADLLALAEQQPEPEALVELPNREVDAGRKKRRTVLIAIVASIAWAIAGWKLYLQSTDDGYQQLALADIYEQCVDDGFQPKWVCDDDREFAETFQRRQGLPLLLQDDAKHVMVGLSYLKGVSARTTTMLARVDDQPVLVFVDRLDRDTHPPEPSWLSGLHLFRKELDGLVLYEVSPLAEPRVLSSFYVPELQDLPGDEIEAATD